MLWVFVYELSIYKLANLKKTCVFQGYIADTPSYAELLGFEMCLTVFSMGFVDVSVVYELLCVWELE